MRPYPQALAWIKGQVNNPTQNWSNLCQSISRQTVGADAWAPSAREAFNDIPAQHRHTSWPPPAGSICYWGNPDVGFGLATFVGEGVIYSNDIYRHGMIDPVRITTRAMDMPFSTQWGLAYRGWIDWTPSGSINLKPVPIKVIPQPKPKTTLSAHLAHLLHLKNTGKSAPATPVVKPVVPAGSGPAWLYAFLTAQGLTGQTLKFMWCIAMRESGGNPAERYPAGAPFDNNWNRDTAPFYDSGCWQLNNRHLSGIKKMFGPNATMQDVLDPVKNLKYALLLTRNGTYFGDWGIKRTDGVEPGFAFDWSGWPSDWVAKYAADSEQGFKNAWAQFDTYAKPAKPAPLPVIAKPTHPQIKLSLVQPGLSNPSVQIIQKALSVEVGLDFSSAPGHFGPKTKAAYEKWQVKCGFTGSDANGIPGMKSLSDLGAKHGFTVIP